MALTKRDKDAARRLVKRWRHLTPPIGATNAYVTRVTRVMDDRNIAAADRPEFERRAGIVG